MWSVVRFTAERVLGLHRKARYKVFPAAVIVMSYLPAVVFVGIVVLSKRLPPGERGFVNGSLVAQYSGYYDFIISAIVLFAAFVGPEVLCPDRTNGMLGLYLAGPLNRLTYLVSKFMSVAIILALVTVGPPLLLLIGYSTQDYGPDGLAQWMSTLGKVLASAAAITVLYGAIVLAVSSLTTRRAAASATVLVLLVGAPIVLQGLVLGARQSPRWLLLSLFSMPRDLVRRIFGERGFRIRSGAPRLPTAEVVASYGIWLALALLVIGWSYRRMRVTR